MIWEPLQGIKPLAGQRTLVRMAGAMFLFRHFCIINNFAGKIV